MKRREAAIAAALFAALASAACSSAPASTPAAPTTPSAVVALSSFVATVETTSTGAIYDVTFQLTETSGQAGATINNITFIYRNGFVSGSMIYTPPAPPKVASGATLTIGPIPVADNSGNVATEIGVSVSYTDDSGHSGSVSGSGLLPVLRFALMGFIRDGSSGQVLAGATAQVTSGPDASVSAVADSNGHYAFPALQAGMFTVQAQASGYVASSQTVTLLAASESDFQLSAVASTSTSGAAGARVGLGRSGTSRR